MYQLPLFALSVVSVMDMRPYHKLSEFTSSVYQEKDALASLALAALVLFKSLYSYRREDLDSSLLYIFLLSYIARRQILLC